MRSGESLAGPLYGTYLVKKFKEGGASFFFHQFRCFEKSVSSSRFAHLVSSVTARLLRAEWRSEGSPLAGAIDRATTLYPVGPGTRTMMQSCASAAKLRSGGPILPVGTKAKGHCRDSATSNRHRRPITSGQGRNCRGIFNVLRSLCRTQNDAVWHDALPHELPQGD